MICIGFWDDPRLSIDYTALRRNYIIVANLFDIVEIAGVKVRIEGNVPKLECFMGGWVRVGRIYHLYK